MLKTKKIIVANWKMNPEGIDEAKKLVKSISKTVQQSKSKIIICPPTIFIEKLSGKSKKIFWGAQNCHKESFGSYTGETSPTMIYKSGVKYVIIGHSERRKIGESDEDVSLKALSAIRAGLSPIICIGEKMRDEHGEYIGQLRNQINGSLKGINRNMVDQVIIAYEPVWAIGASEALDPSGVHEISIFIKKVLSEIYGQKKGFSIPILYGGSVSDDNCLSIVKEGNVDGLLVGRDSLNSEKFKNICKKIDEI